MRQRRVEVFAGPDEVAQAALELWKQRVQEASSPFWVSLAGGSTPRALYQRLAETSEIDWKKVHLLWGDERFVAPDHNDSNYRMVKESLLDKVEFGLARPWSILENAEASAQDYEDWLRQEGPRAGVDLCLLGMGDDGHTASLFPETAALEEDQRWAVANWVPKFESHRLTLTFPYINESREAVFLVTGAGKAQALRQVLIEGSHPSSRVLAREVTRFFVDRAAAAEL